MDEQKKKWLYGAKKRKNLRVGQREKKKRASERAKLWTDKRMKDKTLPEKSWVSSAWEWHETSTLHPFPSCPPANAADLLSSLCCPVRMWPQMTSYRSSKNIWRRSDKICWSMNQMLPASWTIPMMYQSKDAQPTHKNCFLCFAQHSVQFWNCSRDCFCT